ncbi:hypothetical protein BDZ85DRAFT_316654 [Elsinoe ampelina]|uniref:P-loop containing nucleoside triphosphate hydrolase protein n=1 Tax=Elsinoe ampelina TaxID=302913 RepID=A0A6A6GII6_9PEZI|nr:hypothetical protein BDZ85DRAFT_316654 [Elsinoe ampelina]
MSIPHSKRRLEGPEEIARTAGTESYSNVKDQEHGIHTLLTSMASEGDTVLKDHSEFDTGERPLLDHANVSLVPKVENRLKVAIIGASGMGKSALFNVVPHQPSISRSDSSMAGCTSAPCEITGAAPDQKSDYEVYLHFHSDPDRRSTFSKLFDDYQLLHFNNDDTRVCDSVEADRLASAATTLLQLLQSIFADDPNLSEQAGIAETLLAHHDAGTLDAFQETVYSRCEELVEAFPGGDGLVKERHFETTEDVSAFIQPLGSTNDVEGEPSLWPLVKKISVFIKDCPLLQDMVLGDAPGVSDVNQLRERNAYDYIDGCDYLILVTSVQMRCATDIQLEKILSRYKEAFAGKLAIVMTRSDEYDHNDYVRNIQPEAKTKGFHAEVEEYARLHKETKQNGKCPMDYSDLAAMQQWAIAQRAKHEKENR